MLQREVKNQVITTPPISPTPPKKNKHLTFAPLTPSPKGLGLSSYGNAAGSKIESTLSPLGNPLGKGLATAVAPVGNIVGAAVDNGIMRAGRTAGGMTGQGAGGMDTEEVKKGWEEVKEQKRLEEEIGGQEQTKENPLGL